MRFFALLAASASAAALAACSPDAGAVQQDGMVHDGHAETQDAETGAPNTRVEAVAGDMAAPGVQRVEAGRQAGTFTQAWIRTPPTGRDIAAGYVTIATREPDAVLRIQSDAADRVELHTMNMDENVMRMRRVERLKTGPEPVVLAPGGDHIMIFGLSESARLSGTVRLNLYFESGFTAPVEFQISDRMPGVGE